MGKTDFNEIVAEICDSHINSNIKKNSIFLGRAIDKFEYLIHIDYNTIQMMKVEKSLLEINFPDFVTRFKDLCLD